MNKLVHLVMDSGAFSAWRMGGSIDLGEYIEFLQEHAPLLWHTVALDNIPGQWGRARTSDDVERSARISFKNWECMRKAGLDPIPVFHQGERFEWLEQMIKAGARYVGISPSDDTADIVQRDWLDNVFTLLTTEDGMPLIKAHAFGIGNISILKRYPFYSADSTTWAVNPGFGEMMVPHYKDGRPDYSRVPHKIVISDQQQQFEALSPMLQEYVRRYIEEECRTTLSHVRYDNISRRIPAIVFYTNFAKLLRGVRFHHRRNGFFHSLTMDTSNLRPPPGVMQFRMVFATLPDHNRSELLTKIGVRHRLLSFWHVRDRGRMLRIYVEHGMPSRNHEQRAPRQNWNSTAYVAFRKIKLVEHAMKQTRRINAGERP